MRHSRREPADAGETLGASGILACRPQVGVRLLQSGNLREHTFAFLGEPLLEAIDGGRDATDQVRSLRQ